MKVVFLDFDGVLNSHAWFAAGGRSMDEVDPACVKRIDALCERAGNAYVVVSSTWRLGHSRTELQEILAKHGFRGVVIGTTPDLASRPHAVTSTSSNIVGLYVAVPRGEEIQKWLDDYKEVDNRFGPVEAFVIIDDDEDMAHLKSRLVLTEFETGVTDADVERALDVLGRHETAGLRTP